MALGSASPTPEIGTVETIVVDSRVLACDGGAGALGHPRVWLRIVGEQTYCPYCSRVFVLRPGFVDAGHH
jgi:uncharacterized Zn-finger protein